MIDVNCENRVGCTTQSQFRHGATREIHNATRYRVVTSTRTAPLFHQMPATTPTRTFPTTTIRRKNGEQNSFRRAKLVSEKSSPCEVAGWEKSRERMQLERGREEFRKQHTVGLLQSVQSSWTALSTSLTRPQWSGVRWWPCARQFDSRTNLDHVRERWCPLTPSASST